jgi:alkylation response protein AidB-like acyl-CoA dehydrogenase
LPYTNAWDQEKYFPRKEVYKKSADLGMGLAAIYCSEEFGGTGLSSYEASLIFEALAYGCPSLSGYFTV